MTDVSLSDRLGDEFASGEADLSNAAQLASIPSPGDDLQSLLKTVRALKQVVDVLTGVSGSVLDKAPTVREMLQDGTLVYVPSSGLSTGIPAFLTVTSGSTGGGYTDPRPILGVPPTLTNLEAWGAFKTVVLTWDMVGYQNHAYVEVWRAVADNLATAVLIGNSSADLYSDADVTVGQTYYYWVRAVNIENATGAYNAVGGTVGALLRIGSTDLAALAVEAANLASGAVTGPKLAVGAIAIGSAAIENGAIRNALIENAAIDSAKVSSLDAALVSFGEMHGDRISANTLHGDKITSNSILAGKIAANTLTADRMATDLLSANNILTRGLTVRDLNGSVILSSGSAMSWNYVGLGKPVQWRVRASGYTAYNAGGKPFSSVTNMDTETFVSGPEPMYILTRLVRATGAYLTHHIYDTFNGGAAAAAAMAADLNGLSNSEIVVVYSWDEPQANRMSGGLPAAMYRCGASPGVFGASKFQYRSAYILIGVPGCGSGNGYELYRGDTANSVDAFVETTFTIQAGQVNVNGMASQPFIDANNATTYIASAAIGSAQIGSINASTITTGSMDAARITAGSITATQITTANPVIVTSAQMDSDVVDTDSLVREAVLAPRYSYSADALGFSSNTAVLSVFNVGASEADLISMTLTMDISTAPSTFFGDPIDAYVSYNTTVQLKRNGTTILTLVGRPFGAGAAPGSAMVAHTFLDIPGDGTHTYSVVLTATAGTGGVVTNRTLSLLVLKKAVTS